MANIRQEQVINNAAFTATVTSPTYTNDGRAAWSVITKVGAITTTPTLTVQVNVSLDGATWVSAGAGAALSTANATQRLTFAQGGSGVAPTFPPITEPFIQVVVTFGGTGNFANTSVTLVGLGFYD